VAVSATPLIGQEAATDPEEINEEKFLAFLMAGGDDSDDDSSDSEEEFEASAAKRREALNKAKEDAKKNSKLTKKSNWQIKPSLPLKKLQLTKTIVIQTLTQRKNRKKTTKKTKILMKTQTSPPLTNQKKKKKNQFGINSSALLVVLPTNGEK